MRASLPSEQWLPVLTLSQPMSLCLQVQTKLVIDRSWRKVLQEYPLLLFHMPSGYMLFRIGLPIQ